MRFSKFCHPFYVAALIAVLFAAPTRSFADSFEVFDLGEDNGMSFLGLSSAGLAFFESVAPDYSCANDTCFFTYFDGVVINTSSVAPTFTPDNGTLCTPSVPPGGSVARGICNNGLDVFIGTLTSSQSPSTNAGLYFRTTFQQIYVNGFEPFTPYPYPLSMNSLGDMIIDDQANDELYEAVDLTPEPTSFVLLGTGILGLIGVVRRKFLVHS